MRERITSVVRDAALFSSQRYPLNTELEYRTEIHALPSNPYVWAISVSFAVILTLTVKQTTTQQLPSLMKGNVILLQRLQSV